MIFIHCCLYEQQPLPPISFQGALHVDQSHRGVVGVGGSRSSQTEHEPHRAVRLSTGHETEPAGLSEQVFGSTTGVTCGGWTAGSFRSVYVRVEVVSEWIWSRVGSDGGSNRLVTCCKRVAFSCSVCCCGAIYLHWAGFGGSKTSG